MRKKYKYLMVVISSISIEAFSAIPTKVGNINIDSNDVMATIWAIAKEMVYYGAWLTIAVAIITAIVTIISALSEAREKGKTGILWSSIAMSMVTVVIVIVLAILVLSYMDIT